MADTFRLTRSTFIKAPPAIVHALVNDFHQWEQWSPWVKMDAGQLSQTYDGPSSGVGAGYAWTGPKTGKGRMEILASTPAHIGIALDFISPMKRNNKADFTFTPEADGTKVEWAMTGPMGLFDKIMQMFFSMEKMVGPSFEQGLAGIKALAEAAAPKAESAPKPAAAPVAVAVPKASVTPKTPAKPKVPAPPKAAAKPAAPKVKPAAKPSAVKAAPVAKAAPAKTAPVKAVAAKAAPKAKPAATKAPAVKASAAPKTKVAAAPKTAAKAKPAAKSKAPAKKT